ncbi:MAG: hypothetical protein ABIJ21_06365 [Nanoarchaeota archaeon]
MIENEYLRGGLLFLLVLCVIIAAMFLIDMGVDWREAHENQSNSTVVIGLLRVEPCCDRVEIIDFTDPDLDFYSNVSNLLEQVEVLNG